LVNRRRSKVVDANQQISARPLGAVEKLFWLLDQNRPVHFSTVAVIEGRVAFDTWQDCLDELGWATPRIWSGIVAPEGEQPRFVPVTKLSIPLRRINGGMADLVAVIQYEIRMPFDTKRPPLLRAVVLEEGTRSILVLSAHHSIADEMSLNFWMRDLMLAVTGHDIDDRIPCAAVETMVAHAARLRRLPPAKLAAPSRPPVRYRSGASEQPHVQFLSLCAWESEKLSNAIRSHGTTVYGAVVAALIHVAKRVITPNDGGPLRIFTTTDVRPVLLANTEHLCLCLTGSPVQNDAHADEGWEASFRMSSAIETSTSAEEIIASVSALDAAMRAVATVSEAADFFANMFGAELVVTDLGNLDLKTEYGALRLEAVLGPFGTLGFDSEQHIGISQIGGRIHLSYTSFDPVPALLEEIRFALLNMAESGGLNLTLQTRSLR
jgi:hypothetical protein